MKSVYQNRHAGSTDIVSPKLEMLSEQLDGQT